MPTEPQVAESDVVSEDVVILCAPNMFCMVLQQWLGLQDTCTTVHASAALDTVLTFS